jgi:hypothetical protein
VDTWTGPDQSVRSGQRLADCPLVNELHDDVFPTWISYHASIYRATGLNRPVGTDPEPAYHDTGYRLGSLHLLDIRNTPDGLDGTTVLLKLNDVPIGQVFLKTPDCA